MPKSLPNAFLTAISRDFPPELWSDDADVLSEWGRDWTRVFSPAASGLARPASTDEVSRLLRLCNHFGVAVVPSGGRTGYAGGAVAASGELVLSLARMRRIDAVDLSGATVRTQAGVTTQAVHEHCAVHGLTWPVDFASKGSSQVGGNIATNAGGVKVIRYGLTRQWVLGLQVVLASGDVLELGGALEKNNTGIDLRQLFIGSEGILGVITEATLKLTRLPQALSVYLFALDSLKAVLRLLREARAAPTTLAAFELFTDRCLARLRAHRGVSAPFANDAPYYALLELEGGNESELASWLDGLFAAGLVQDGVMATSSAQAKELWALREGISEALAATGLPHKNDIALPVAALDDFCGELDSVFARRYPDWEICLFGHIGDGNLHINVMKPGDLDKEAFLARTHEADRDLFELVARYRGSISAEHGIGLLKKPHLHYSRSAEELALMRALKTTLDPKGILNPGKIID